MIRSSVFLAILGCAAMGCSAEEPDGDGVVETPTWYDDVAPILARHCQRCHEEGGIAPFPLMSYAQSQPLSALIAASTAARRMPPFLADNSGDCNHFVDANWLSDQDLETLSRWHATGAQEGAPKEVPAAPQLPSIEQPDLVVEMSEPYLPDPEKSDDYRCFLLDPELDRERYVTRYEVVPGDPRVVHHVILYAARDRAAEAMAQELTDEQPRAGYDCYGGAGVPSTMIAAWAPGTGATSFPAGTGLPLRAHGQLIMQIHYNMASGSFPDQTAIKLSLKDQVARPGRMSVFGNNDLSIPPGLSEHVESQSVELRRVGVRTPRLLWGILPHMHEIGVSYQLEKISGNQTMCLMNVRRWDFNWQLSYFLEEPIRLEPGDSLRTTCRFDSRSRTEVTRFGEDTDDEMCLALVFTTEAD